MAWRGEQAAGARTMRAPNQAYGYYQGYGLQTEGSGMGVKVAGRGTVAAGQNAVSVGGQAWHPTILYLFVLIVGEMFVFGLLAKLLR